MFWSAHLADTEHSAQIRPAARLYLCGGRTGVGHAPVRWRAALRLRSGEKTLTTNLQKAQPKKLGPETRRLRASLLQRHMREIYHPPVKRSVEIAGHKTSISLEPLFWDVLNQVAKRDSVPLNALIARIDAERLDAEHPPGLATAVRLWLAGELQRRALSPDQDQ